MIGKILVIVTILSGCMAKQQSAISAATTTPPPKTIFSCTNSNRVESLHITQAADKTLSADLTLRGAYQFNQTYNYTLFSVEAPSPDGPLAKPLIIYQSDSNPNPDPDTLMFKIAINKNASPNGMLDSTFKYIIPKRKDEGGDLYPPGTQFKEVVYCFPL